MNESLRENAVPAAFVVAVLLFGTVFGWTPSNSAASDEESVALDLVAFAVPKSANDAVQAAWARTDEGAGVTFNTSYGASGDQSRAVESGKSADYVHFSLEHDVTRLVKAGLVAEDWNSGPHEGIVSDSVVVLVVRKGNPKNIRGWDDIVRPGVGIVTPNPGSSGSARWNILAAWAHATADGDEGKGEEFLRKFFANAVTLSGSGREATTAFQGGAGDVLVSYENEAIFARQQGEDFEYVVPDTTLLIENPAAVLRDAAPEARQFLDFVLSDRGQRIFAAKGFRPVVDIEVGRVEGANDPANPYPPPGGRLVMIADLGGWDAVNQRFFATKDKDGVDGLITTIQNESGKGV